MTKLITRLKEWGLSLARSDVAARVLPGESMSLMTALVLRIGVILIVWIRFRVLGPSRSWQTVGFLTVVVWAAGAAILSYLRLRRVGDFMSRRAILAQFYLDLLCASVVLWATQDPTTGLMLCYLLPLYVAARHLGLGSGLFGLMFALINMLAFQLTILPVSQTQGLTAALLDAARWKIALSNLTPDVVLLVVIPAGVGINRLFTSVAYEEPGREWLANLFDLLEQRFYIVDEELRLLEVSPTLGYQHGEISKGVTCHQYLAGEARACRGCPALEAMQTEAKVVATTMTFREARGDTYSTDLQAYPIRGPDARVNAILVTSSNLQAQEELARVLTTMWPGETSALAVLASAYEESEVIRALTHALMEAELRRGEQLTARDMAREIYLILAARLHAPGFFLVIYDSGRHQLSFLHTVDDRQTILVGDRWNDDGLAEWIVSTGKKLLVTDLLEERDALPVSGIQEGRFPRSIAGVPIRTDGEIVGAICLQAYSPAVYDRRDIDLLTSLTVPIGRALRVAEGEERLRAVEEMLKASQRLALCGDRKALYDNIASEGAGLLRAEECSLMIADSERKVLEFVASNCIPLEARDEWQMPISTDKRVGLAGYVATAGVPVRLVKSQYGHYDAWAERTEHHGYLASGDSYSVCITPIVVSANEVIGVLKVENKLGRPREGGFSWIDEDILASFSAMVGVLIERQRHIDATSERVAKKERLRLLDEIHEARNRLHLGAITQLELMRSRLVAGEPKDVQELASQLAGPIAEGRQVLSALRDCIEDLIGAPVVHVGLTRALRRVAKRVGLEKIEIQEKIVVSPPVDVEHALLRVGQEALYNAAKHAKPGQPEEVRIDIEYISSSRKVRLVIRDDGQGFDANAAMKEGKALGLQRARERIEDLGGMMRVLSERGQGTTISVEIALKELQGNG